MANESLMASNGVDARDTSGQTVNGPGPAERDRQDAGRKGLERLLGNVCLIS